MTVEEFEKATEKELRTKANECLVRAAGTGFLDRPGLLLEAKFYLDEIKQREDNKIVRRDLRLELVIIALIGLELLLGIGGIIVGGREATEQAGLLAKLQTSAEATTATIDHLAKITDDMSKSVQTELALNYAVSVDVSYQMGDGKIYIKNSGRTDITMWGNRFSRYAQAMEPTPLLVPQNGVVSVYQMVVRNDFSMVPPSEAATPATVFPFEIYLQNSQGREYVAKVAFVAKKTGENLQVLTQTGSIKEQAWSRQTLPLR